MDSVRTLARKAGDVVLSSPPASGIARQINKRNLRVLTYHGVDDPAVFDHQMAHIRDRYVPVAAQDVVATLKGEHELPDNAVWITFDDGEPSVAHNAMNVLEARGIQATMFICPSVIDTTEPLWWQLVELSACHGIFPEGASSEAAAVSALKTLADEDRVRQIEILRTRLRDTLGHEVVRPQLTTDDLTTITSAGHTLGNHTWTHPLLDRCSPSTQQHEIVRAHDWFTSRLGIQMSLFAYPNGNHTPYAEATLGDLGYDVAALFDHQISSPSSPRLRLSRLRVSDDNSMKRFSSILAGTHPFAHGVRGRSKAAS